MQNNASPMLIDQFLSTAPGYVATAISGAMRASGNKAVLGVLVKNISASSTFTIYLDGSYDNQAWKELTSSTQNSFGYTTIAQTGVDCAFLRVRCVLAGTTVSALFNVYLDVSSQ